MMKAVQTGIPTRQKGLTLIELLVVVAVISILASVAIPLYTEQVQKSRRADGRVALTTIAAAQERFFTLNGRYTANLGSLSIDTDLQSGDSEAGFYNLAVNATTTSFIVTATPDSTTAQAGDDCTLMRLNSVGVKDGTGSGCWPN